MANGQYIAGPFMPEEYDQEMWYPGMGQLWFNGQQPIQPNSQFRAVGYQGPAAGPLVNMNRSWQVATLDRPQHFSGQNGGSGIGAEHYL